MRTTAPETALQASFRVGFGPPSVIRNWTDRTAACALALSQNGIFFTCLLEDLMNQTSTNHVADVMCTPAAACGLSIPVIVWLSSAILRASLGCASIGFVPALLSAAPGYVLPSSVHRSALFHPL